ncbi:PIG-L deacetylase family protein [Pseudomonas fakonensis]|nr:PIG-L deacetylase family protein [Pseudomonas fakonensis]
MLGVRSVLAIGAHPDDLELGCGATLAKLVAAGVRVRALVLSEGFHGAERGLHDRCTETRSALHILGVTDVVQARLPDTSLPKVMSNIIAIIEAQCADFKPDRVYTMFEHDRHQDHRAVYEASIVACRGISQILSYETPSAWPNFMPVVFEPVEDFMALKVSALQCHASQAHRPYMREQQVRCNAQFRGHQVGLGPSEGFVPYKFVL